LIIPSQVTDITDILRQVFAKKKRERLKIDSRVRATLEKKRISRCDESA
jgi:hypothetical protein